MRVSAGKALKYTLLPGIVPRLKDFAASGLSHIAVFMASVYSMARLLPPHHPYLDPANMGRFGIRHVMGQARKNLVFSRENTDQIVIYYTIQLGMLLLLMQVFMLILSFSVSGAFAAGFGPYISQFFVRPNVTYDIAFIFLDSVFGFQIAPPLYNSCVAQGVSCDPNDATIPLIPFNTPFQQALHTLFNFYNLGILGIGLLVFLYLVVTLVGETAQTGTPFGRRFNHAWAVPRLLLALILLMPMTWGMDGAQLVVLRVAKWGSNLASNGWDRFNLALAGNTVLGPNNTLVFNPNPPEFDGLAQAIFMAQTCQAVQELMYGVNRQIRAYQVDKKNVGLLPVIAPATFTGALVGSGNHDIFIVFGEIQLEYVGKYAMGVRPLCGEVMIRITALGAIPGAYAVQSAYYTLLMNLWNDPGMRSRARIIAERIMPVWNRVPTANPLPDSAFLESMKIWLRGQLVTAITNGRNAQIADPAWTTAITNRGWGGAGLWYNRIAELNGRFIASVRNLPMPTLFPEVMEYVRAQRLAKDSTVSGPEAYNPSLSGNEKIDFQEPGEEKQAIALYIANKLWNIDDRTAETGSPVTGLMSKIFGLDGLFNMRNNMDVHPLAQLTGVGASLIQGAIINGLASGSFGAISLLFDKSSDSGRAASEGFKSLAGAAASVAKSALMIGFVLYYIVPLLPFIYFFFAVGGWVKGIFEAMVGLPLWALAHVRIDGEGLPGNTAMGGYFLIFEIFLRPILIISGLIASITIFSAMVIVLNMVWSQVVTNVGGADSTPTGIAPGATGAIDFVRDSVGAFAYTIIYTIVVYMIGMGSFKLIDAIPNNIMRWMGAGVSSFGETLGDPGGQLVDYGFQGTNLALGSSGLLGLFGRWAPASD